MDAARLATERRRAIDRIADLHDALEGIDAARDALGSTDDEHDPEGATIAVERAQLVGLLADAEQALVAVDKVADRLAAGIYERCATCGGDIGRERLAARPTTDRCVACASSDSRPPPLRR